MKIEWPFEEVVRATVGAALEVDERPVDGDFRQAGQCTERDLLDAGLDSHGVAVAAETGVDPEHVDQGFFGSECGFSSRRWHVPTLPGVAGRPREV
jgi:hypothetical protein